MAPKNGQVDSGRHRVRVRSGETRTIVIMIDLDGGAYNKEMEEDRTLEVCN